jgi:hypothetical protein
MLIRELLAHGEIDKADGVVLGRTTNTSIQIIDLPGAGTTDSDGNWVLGKGMLVKFNDVSHLEAVGTATAASAVDVRDEGMKIAAMNT